MNKVVIYTVENNELVLMNEFIKSRKVSYTLAVLSDNDDEQFDTMEDIANFVNGINGIKDNYTDLNELVSDINNEKLGELGFIEVEDFFFEFETWRADEGK